MKKCFICGNSIEPSLDARLSREVVATQKVQLETGNIVRICWECSCELHGKVALVAEKEGIRTGEVIFVARTAFLNLCRDDARGNDVIITTPFELRKLALALMDKI